MSLCVSACSLVLPPLPRDHAWMIEVMLEVEIEVMLHRGREAGGREACEAETPSNLI